MTRRDTREMHARLDAYHALMRVRRKRLLLALGAMLTAVMLSPLLGDYTVVPAGISLSCVEVFAVLYMTSKCGRCGNSPFRSGCFQHPVSSRCLRCGEPIYAHRAPKTF